MPCCPRVARACVAAFGNAPSGAASFFSLCRWVFAFAVVAVARTSLFFFSFRPCPLRGLGSRIAYVLTRGNTQREEAIANVEEAGEARQCRDRIERALRLSLTHSHSLTPSPTLLPRFCTAVARRLPPPLLPRPNTTPTPHAHTRTHKARVLKTKTTAFFQFSPSPSRLSSTVFFFFFFLCLFFLCVGSSRCTSRRLAVSHPLALERALVRLPAGRSLTPSPPLPARLLCLFLFGGVLHAWRGVRRSACVIVIVCAALCRYLSVSCGAFSCVCVYFAAVWAEVDFNKAEFAASARVCAPRLGVRVRVCC